jgi:hypothetical protein
MPETSEASFRSTDYMEMLSDSAQYSKTVRNALYAEFAVAEKGRYDRAGAALYPLMIFHVACEWIFLAGAPTDNWD